MVARAGLVVARRVDFGVVAGIGTPFDLWMHHPGVVVPGPRGRMADVK